MDFKILRNYTWFLLFLCYSCATKNDCEEKSCNKSCYEIYAPVCGCNGETYENDCFAECNGITEYTKGECK